MPQALASLTVVGSSIPSASEDCRVRALQRLYIRRAAVDELIQSLEEYQESCGRKAPCIAINAVARKCS